MEFFLANSTSINDDVVLGGIKIPGEVIDFLIKKGFSILIIIFLMFISIKIGTGLINKFEKRQIENQNSRLALSPQKARTMGAVMHSILKYAVYFVGIATILSNIFTGMSLTFASMGGFAVGFGAQSLSSFAQFVEYLK